MRADADPWLRGYGVRSLGKAAPVDTDTLFAIAEQFAPPGTDPADFANSISAANGITDASSLQIGQELIIPGE